MNKIILMGNLTRDPEVRYTAGEKQIAVCRFCIAVNRKSKSKNSNQSNTEVDFINCAAFGKTGENISKFFTKGKRIAVEGRLQISTYTKDDEKRYSADVIVENFDFCESKGNSSGGQEQERFYTEEDDDDEDLPF